MIISAPCLVTTTYRLLSGPHCLRPVLQWLPAPASTVSCPEIHLLRLCSLSAENNPEAGGASAQALLPQRETLPPAGCSALSTRGESKTEVPMQEPRAARQRGGGRRGSSHGTGFQPMTWIESGAAVFLSQGSGVPD